MSPNPAAGSDRQPAAGPATGAEPTTEVGTSPYRELVVELLDGG